MLTITTELLVSSRVSCPVCRSKERTILVKARHDSPNFLKFIKNERFYGKEFYDSYNNGPVKELLFEVAECKNCHFLYLTQVLSDTGMDLLYNEWLDKELLKGYYANMPYNIYEELMLSVINKAFKKKKKRKKLKVMDFGAGYGNFCSIATKLGINTYAFDLSTDKNEHMENMGVTIINNLQEFRGSFDFIYVNQVAEHVSSPGGMLSNLRECLADDGFMYVATPDSKNAKKELMKNGLSSDFFKFISPHQHINAFTNRTLRLLGQNIGLKPFTMFDFMTWLNTSLSSAELKYVIKRIIKNSSVGTAIFFKKS